MRCLSVFSVGDKVVYPLHGAGIIEDLEEKRIDGRVQSYYVLRLPVGNLKIMISVKNAEGMGIRPVMPIDELIGAMESISSRPVKMNENWNLRYKENLEKIKTGFICESAEVFRNLRLRERQRGLSSAEKKMLSTVKQIILSEIILSHDVEKPTAEEILETAIRDVAEGAV